MTEQVVTKTWWQREGKTLAWFLAAVLLIGGGFLIFNTISENRARAANVDAYYCTLSGITPFDEAPSGKLCIDVG